MKSLQEKLGFLGKGPLLDRVRSLRARRKNVYDRLRKIDEALIRKRTERTTFPQRAVRDEITRRTGKVKRKGKGKYVVGLDSIGPSPFKKLGPMYRKRQVPFDPSRHNIQGYQHIQDFLDNPRKGNRRPGEEGTFKPGRLP